MNWISPGGQDIPAPQPELGRDRLVSGVGGGKQAADVPGAGGQQGFEEPDEPRPVEAVDDAHLTVLLGLPGHEGMQQRDIAGITLETDGADIAGQVAEPAVDIAAEPCRPGSQLGVVGGETVGQIDHGGRGQARLIWRERPLLGDQVVEPPDGELALVEQLPRIPVCSRSMDEPLPQRSRPAEQGGARAEAAALEWEESGARCPVAQDGDPGGRAEAADRQREFRRQERVGERWAGALHGSPCADLGRAQLTRSRKVHVQHQFPSLDGGSR
jgi:hypothetical protein